MKFLSYIVINLYFFRITAHISDIIEEVDESNENEDELEPAPITEEVIDPNIKTNNPMGMGNTEEVLDPTWNKNKVIRDVAYFIRAHKFHDYDRRYYNNIDEVPKRLYQEFPKPPLRAYHWEVHKHCDNGFIACLKYLEKIIRLTSLRREDDTVTVMREQLWTLSNNSQQIIATERECQMAKRRDNRTAVPFQGPIERFQWRTSVSYYMCWYAMLGVPELAFFGEPCDNHANCLDEYGVNNRDPRADDSKPYACALYSFCPDHCCPIKHIWYWTDCFQSQKNPCYEENESANRKCVLHREENQDFSALLMNQINVTCECHEPGYEWSSRFGMCIDINECTRERHNCSEAEQETCINLPGNFDCICHLGFVYSPEKKRCVPSRSIEKALRHVETEESTTDTNSIFTFLIKMIARSAATSIINITSLFLSTICIIINIIMYKVYVS